MTSELSDLLWEYERIENKKEKEYLWRKCFKNICCLVNSVHRPTLEDSDGSSWPSRVVHPWTLGTPGLPSGFCSEDLEDQRQIHLHSQSSSGHRTLGCFLWTRGSCKGLAQWGSLGGSRKNLEVKPNSQDTKRRRSKWPPEFQMALPASNRGIAGERSPAPRKTSQKYPIRKESALNQRPDMAE